MKEAARDMGISGSTMRQHLHYAYEKIGATNMTQAVVIMVQQGWTSEKPPPTPEEPERALTDAERLYIKAFDRWGFDPTPLNFKIRKLYFAILQRESGSKRW